jgi:hypothetical protein
MIFAHFVACPPPQERKLGNNLTRPERPRALPIPRAPPSAPERPRAPPSAPEPCRSPSAPRAPPIVAPSPADPRSSLRAPERPRAPPNAPEPCRSPSAPRLSTPPEPARACRSPSAPSAVVGGASYQYTRCAGRAHAQLVHHRTPLPLCLAAHSAVALTHRTSIDIPA